MNRLVYPTTPLRYPGAKKKVLHKILPFLKTPHDEYREPFVGGGAVFFGKPVSKISWINDLDPDIHAFFLAMKMHPEALCQRVRETTPELVERKVALWDEIKSSRPETLLERGFRTLFLNRTNYSGILSANPIGGRSQNPKYPIYCRWNAELLCKNIVACSEWLQTTEITCLDFSPVITSEPRAGRVLLFLDPPYYHKGNTLYQQGMEPHDHQYLAQLLHQLDANKFKFVLTYDDCPEVRALYSGWAYVYTEQWFYSTVKSTVQQRQLGRELIITNFRGE